MPTRIIGLLWYTRADPNASLEARSQFGPVSALFRDRAVAFAIVIIALERGRIGHRDAMRDPRGKLVTALLPLAGG